MTQVFIKNTTRKKFIYKKLFNDLAKAIVEGEKIKGKSEVGLIIVADKKVKTLAKVFKNKEYITDVLSFRNDWKELAKLTNINVFGDIYLNHNKVSSQAKKYGHSEKREYAYLFAHGLLHLIGYDHQDDKTEKLMHTKVKKALKKTGVIK